MLGHRHTLSPLVEAVSRAFRCGHAFARLFRVSDSLSDAPEASSALEKKPDTTASTATSGTTPATRLGPDPVIGAGITLLGIFLMGTGGATDAHYVFDVGVLFALVGAGTCVALVTLSVMRMSQDKAGPEPHEQS